MRFRYMRPEDVLSCSKIAGLGFGKKYEKLSYKELEAMFQENLFGPKYIVVEEKGQVIGFGGYTQSWMDYLIYDIFWVTITPDYQRQGVGTKLVGKIISEIKKDKKAKKILLSSTKPDFYSKKFGFKKLSTVANENDFLMELDL